MKCERIPHDSEGNSILRSSNNDALSLHASMVDSDTATSLISKFKDGEYKTGSLDDNISSSLCHTDASNRVYHVLIGNINSNYIPHIDTSQYLEKECFTNVGKHLFDEYKIPKELTMEEPIRRNMISFAVVILGFSLGISLLLILLASLVIKGGGVCAWIFNWNQSRLNSEYIDYTIALFDHLASSHVSILMSDEEIYE